MRIVASVACGVGLGLCAAVSVPVSADDTTGMPAAAAAPRRRTAPLHVDPRTLAGLEPPSVPEIDAGVIERAALRAELARGVAYFLRQVPTAAAFSDGHFVGWRLLGLYAKRSDVHVQGLRAGDTVSHVNGRSIEHPEVFKRVWDSLADARELVFDVRRDGHPLRVRFTIE